MAADASIYSLIRPPTPGPGPLEQYGQTLQLRNLMDAQQLHGLQRQQLQKSIDEDDATSAAYRESGGDISKVKDLLYGKGLYKPAQAVEKTLLERQEKQGTIEKNRLDGLKTSTTLWRDAVANVRGDQDLPMLRDQAVRIWGPQVGPQMVPQAFDPEWQRAQVTTAEKRIEQMTPKYERQDIGGKVVMVDMNPNTNPAVKTMNLEKTLSPGERQTGELQRASQAETRRHNIRTEGSADASREGADWHYDGERGLLVNKRTGATKAPTTQDGKPIQADPKLTEGQGKATGFSLRARESADLINELEGKGTFGRISGTKEGVRGALERVPVVGTAAGNVAGAALNTVMSDAQQKYEQATRDFINAVLRVESGATIQQSEFDNAYRQYFPQAGDSQATISQKRANRENAINALKAQAGQGVSKIPAARNVAGVLTQNPDGSYNYGSQ